MYSGLWPRIKARQLDSCYLLGTPEGNGTCFELRVQGRSVLVTARHLLQRTMVGDNVRFLGPRGLESKEVTSLVLGELEDDIAVFEVPGLPFQPHRTKDTAIGSFEIGDPHLFLGFPHGLHHESYSRPFRLPLVKGGIYSGSISIREARVHILDGINNPGFSGGPVYCHTGYQNEGDGSMTARISLAGNRRQEPGLVGVISGYHFETKNVGRVYSDKTGEEVPTDHYYVKGNSGMIYVTDIEKVLDIVAKF